MQAAPDTRSGEFDPPPRTPNIAVETADRNQRDPNAEELRNLFQPPQIQAAIYIDSPGSENITGPWHCIKYYRADRA